MSDLDRLYDAIKKLNRKIDVVFANAGISLLAPFGAVDEKFFDLHCDANVKGLFFTVQKALPLLNDGAAITLNGSIATIKGIAATSVYSAAKAAVRSFARTWTTNCASAHSCERDQPWLHRHFPARNPDKQGEALVKLKEEMTNSAPWAGWAIRTISPKRSRSLHPMKRATVPCIELFVDGGVAQI